MKPIIRISALSACVLLAACGGSSSSGGGGGATLGESSPNGNIDMWEYAIPVSSITHTYKEFGHNDWSNTWEGDGLEYEDWEVFGDEAKVTYRYEYSDPNFGNDYAIYKKKGNKINITFAEVDPDATYTSDWQLGRYFKDGKTYQDSEGDPHKVFGPKKDTTIDLPTGVIPQTVKLNDYVVEVSETAWIDEWDDETYEEYYISISYYEKGKGFVFGYDFEDCPKGLSLKEDHEYYMEQCEYSFIMVMQ